MALDGAGWHPAAWREPGARPGELFSARYWADLARTAERGLLDLLTLEDALGLQSGDHLTGPQRRTDRVQGRLDASLVAAFLAPLTSRIGLVPTVTTTHTEPFHVASALSTLDHGSSCGTGGSSSRAHLPSCSPVPATPTPASSSTPRPGSP